MEKMIILCDTRQKKGKHQEKEKWFAENGIEVVRSKLVVGDYTLPTDQSVCIDTKAGLLEVCGNVTQQHRRFVEELELAKQLGIQLIILVEENGIRTLEDVNRWSNPRLRFSPKATTGETLYNPFCHGTAAWLPIPVLQKRGGWSENRKNLRRW